MRDLGELKTAPNSPKILFIGGTHPRHLYYANQIHGRYPLAGAVLEDRGSMMPIINRKMADERAVVLWERHFNNRKSAELNYFGYAKMPFGKMKIVNFDSDIVLEFVQEVVPDIVLIFGCGIIKGELAEALPELTINLHLGLSPRYRGAATLFWPFYFLEPQWAGCTFHKIVDEPDAGDILHQCVPELERGDKIHDVACKAVGGATQDMIKLLGMWEASNWVADDWDYRINAENYWGHVNNDIRFHPQSATGKNFLSRDFQPSHLRMIYETYNDDIVDQYLEGNLKQHKPKLVRQF